MKLFDLVFLAALPALVVALVWAAALGLRGQRARALRLLGRLGPMVGVYLLVEVGVSLATPQRVLGIGATRRFDDWCIAVTDATTATRVGALAAGPDQFVVLKLRVFSEARRISQAAPQASVHLTDARGRRYDVDAPAQQAFEQELGVQPPLGSRLAPSFSFATVRIFRVPAELRSIDVVTPHGGGPGAFIIGDDDSLLHQPTVVRVALPPLGAEAQRTVATEASPSPP